MHKDDALTWFEIPAADLGRATRFYETILYRSLKTETMGTSFAPGFFIDPKPGERLDALRRAIVERRFTDLDYKDSGGQATQRRVRPLGLYFWGDAWTLGAWCELRRDFRNFRLDRIEAVSVADAPYPDEAGKRLEDYVRKMQED